MAAEGLKNFKEVVQNKAFRINPKDRKIFEEGDMQSFFGLSEDDLIEFIMYDSSENQLPQKGFGRVRYIPLTTTNINNYFLLAEGTTMTRNNLPSEFFIDVERLIKEAGFTNGVFKTQISLINKRLGSYQEKDKVWISEISPSRTEVRLFPLMTSPNAEDIKNRFNIFYTNGDFKSDIIYNVFKMIESTTPSLIIDTLKLTFGEAFYNKLKTEYKIQNFDLFAANVHKKFIESAQYEFTNRVSFPKDPNYGKPKKTKPSLQLSEATIMKLLDILIVNAITFYLPPKDEQLNPLAKNTTDVSMDDAAKILQTKTLDEKIDARTPETRRVFIEKPEISTVEREFKKKLLPILPIDDSPPQIITPVEKETPSTGEIKVIDAPPKEPIIDDTPIRIDLPVKSDVISGGGGGGSSYDNFFGAGSGREQIFERDMNQRENIQ